MGVANVPAAAGGGIKSVQRGSAGGAGTVTITTVDTAKAFVNIFGTTSSGTVSASFNMSLNAGNVSFIGNSIKLSTNSNSYWGRPTGTTAAQSTQTTGSAYGGNGSAWTIDRTVNAGNASVGAGSNNLVAAVVQGYLSGSTSLVVSGACRWEVVEFA